MQTKISLSGFIQKQKIKLYLAVRQVNFMLWCPQIQKKKRLEALKRVFHVEKILWQNLCQNPDCIISRAGRGSVRTAGCWLRPGALSSRQQTADRSRHADSTVTGRWPGQAMRGTGGARDSWGSLFFSPSIQCGHSGQPGHALHAYVPDISSTIIHILQMGKAKHREVK